MKSIVMLLIVGGALIGFGACQNRPHQPPNNFNEKTHRSYNPETGAWEQSPPYGRESNKTTN